MTSQFSRFQLTRLSRVALFCGVLGLYHTASGQSPEAALKASVVPGATLQFRADSAAMRKTAFHKMMEGLREDAAEAVEGNQALMMQQKLEEFSEAFGVSQDDIDSMVASVSLAGLTFEGPPDWNQVSLMVASSLLKPIDMATVKLGLTKVATETGQEFMFNEREYRGLKTLSVATITENAPKFMPEEFYVALPCEGRVVYVGLEGALKGALDRLADAAPAANAEMAAAQKQVKAGAQTYMLFVPTDGMRQKVKELLAKNPPSDNPVAAGAMKAFGGMEFLAYSAKMSDKMDILVSSDFATVQEAIQMKSMVDMTVLGMAKMMLMQAIGRPIPLIESMKSDQKGDRVLVEASVTEEDAKALIELQASGNGPFGPGGFPGGFPGGAPPPNMPGGVPAPAQ